MAHAPWSWVLAETDGTPLIDLDAATGRRLTLRLEEPSDAGFSLPAESEEAAAIVELATDLLIYRGDDLVYRGRVGGTQDSGSPDVATLSVSTYDYREVLKRRITYAALNYTAIDQHTIGWNLINYTQGLSGGDLGITNVASTHGVARDRVYEAGSNIGELIANLSQVENGFDWTITPTMEYRTFYPIRGVPDTSPVFVAEYGGAVTAYSRTVSPSNYANAIRVNGEAPEGSEIVPTDTEVIADMATAPEGRWDAQIGLSGVTLQTTVNERAPRLLEEYSQVMPSYSLSIDPELWGGPPQTEGAPTGHEAWLGDHIMVEIAHGRLDISQVYRLHEIDISLGDDGGEEIRFSVGTKPSHLWSPRSEYEIRHRLTELERR